MPNFYCLLNNALFFFQPLPPSPPPPLPHTFENVSWRFPLGNTTVLLLLFLISITSIVCFVFTLCFCYCCVWSYWWRFWSCRMLCYSVLVKQRLFILSHRLLLCFFFGSIISVFFSILTPLLFFVCLPSSYTISACFYPNDFHCLYVHYVSHLFPCSFIYMVCACVCVNVSVWAFA